MTTLTQSCATSSRTLKIGMHGRACSRTFGHVPFKEVVLVWRSILVQKYTRLSFLGWSCSLTIYCNVPYWRVPLYTHCSQMTSHFVMLSLVFRVHNLGTVYSGGFDKKSCWHRKISCCTHSRYHRPINVKIECRGFGLRLLGDVQAWCACEDSDLVVGVAVILRRALQVWGSWQVLEHTLEKRRYEMEEEDRRRQGLSSLITYLKKVNKDQIRRVQDAEVYRTFHISCPSKEKW